MATYGCVTVNALANEDVVGKIYEQLHEQTGYYNTRFVLKFVGFEADQGVSFKINNVPNQVPSTKYFITPYGGNYYMPIYSLTFDSDFSGNIYYII